MQQSDHTFDKQVVHNKPSHKFADGESVNIIIHDWNIPNENLIVSRIVPGQISSKVFRPFGYNVKLSEPVTFYGHIPLTFSRSNRDSIGQVDMQANSICLQEIFVREDDVLKQPINLRRKLARFMSTLLFRKITTVHSKPVGQIEYINYHSPDGKILTVPDDKKLVDQPDAAKRLAYKVSHFYGFSTPISELSSEDGRTKGKDIHFTMNRYAQIDFWNGIEWQQINRSKAFRPSQGDLICGAPPAVLSEQAPSYDRWFVCSPQLRFLCSLIIGTGQHPPINDVINLLIMPENPSNFYTPHEIPISRFLYAAIYLLACRPDVTIPSEWNLPKRDRETFEVWWPKKMSSEDQSPRKKA